MTSRNVSAVVLDRVNQFTDWVDTQHVVDCFTGALDRKQVCNALYRLANEQIINRKKEGARCLYKPVQNHQQLLDLKHKNTVVIPDNNGGVTKDVKLENALEAVSIIASERETYRNALLAIQSILNQALGAS